MKTIAGRYEGVNSPLSPTTCQCSASQSAYCHPVGKPFEKVWILYAQSVCDNWANYDASDDTAGLKPFLQDVQGKQVALAFRVKIIRSHQVC